MDYLSIKRKKRTGFTLVELLVVIAILAVLASVSVVGYLGFVKKARVSNDISLTTQMNRVLLASEAGGENIATPHDAIKTLEDNGLDVTKITPTADGYNYVYDSKNTRMILIDENKNVVSPSELADQSIDTLASTSGNKKVDYFVFVSSESEVCQSGSTETTASAFQGFSYYLKDGFKFSDTDNAFKLNVGIDVGNNVSVKKIEYENTVSSGYDYNVIIRTNGGEVTIKDESQSRQYHYGVASSVTVTQTGTSCYHEYGAVGNFTINAGKAIAEDGGIAYLVNAVDSSGNAATVSENGGKFIIPGIVKTNEVRTDTAKSLGYDVEGLTDNSSEHTYADKTRTNGSYEIDSLDNVETFRDLVNSGFTFKGLTVELKSDITLKDGWVPIGEGARDGSFNIDENGAVNNQDKSNFNGLFAGTFDGNNHTIYNLNSEGYKPHTRAVYKKSDTKNTVSYGFFGNIAGATIKNVKLSNVNIDLTNGLTSDDGTKTNIEGDAIGALVGCAKGNDSINIFNVEVSGSIKALDAVGGVVGRIYAGEDKAKELNGQNINITIKECTNNATVSSTGEKAAGIVGYTTYYDKLEVSGCKNTGNITSGWLAAGIVLYSDQLVRVTSTSIYKNVNSGKITITENSTKSNFGLSFIAQPINVFNSSDNGAYQGSTRTCYGNTNSGEAYFNDTKLTKQSDSSSDFTPMLCDIYSTGYDYKNSTISSGNNRKEINNLKITRASDTSGYTSVELNNDGTEKQAQ